jgi:hypothetical protein
MLRLEPRKLTTTLCTLMLVPGMIWAAACGGDDAAPVGKGGGAGTGAGGSAGVGGSGAGTGGTGTGTGGSGTGTGGVADDGSAGATSCTPASVPNEHITDFSDYQSTGSWGATGNLTGGTFTYQGDAAFPLNAILDTAATNLHITATIAPGSYAGFGFSFGPACSDASRYVGVTFTMAGNAGGAQTLMQVQTDGDYPPMANRGHCALPDASFSVCGFPSQTFTLASPAAATTLLFTNFASGKPVATVDSQRIVGLQWQFNCPGGDGGTCMVDVTMDDVAFAAGSDM